MPTQLKKPMVVRAMPMSRNQADRVEKTSRNGNHAQYAGLAVDGQEFAPITGVRVFFCHYPDKWPDLTRISQEFAHASVRRCRGRPGNSRPISRWLIGIEALAEVYFQYFFRTPWLYPGSEAQGFFIGNSELTDIVDSLAFTDLA
jgi:hypothetical protein